MNILGRILKSLRKLADSDRPVEAILGLFIIVIAVYFLVVGITSKTTNVVGGYTLNTTVDSVANLPTGSFVMIHGIQVGTVSNIHLNPTNYRVHIQMNINSNIKIPNDSSVEIVSAGLMSDKYIRVIPGSSNETFKPNDNVPGKSAETLEEMIGKMVFSL